MIEAKDRRLKFIELPNRFEARASEIDITAKQHLRYCQKLAKQLAGRIPKTAEEFEKVEAMKDFVIKSVELNEKTIELLGYLKGVLTEIAEDSKTLCQDAHIFDRLQDQSDTILIAWQQRDKAINDLYESKKSSFRSAAN